MNKRLIAMGVNQKLALANKKLQRMMPYMGVHHLKPLTVGSCSAVRLISDSERAEQDMSGEGKRKARHAPLKFRF